ncbi:MAG: GDP-mannose mannosyl hydrolase [Anaerolineales bacterium]|nr:MAG: GDP-mannose mannosyl hydrolase [Anaerolineales bacterium]
MSPPTPLEHYVFADIIRHAPLVSMDLIVRDTLDQVLLGLRNNAPASGKWFVPGGRIFKGERLSEALGRVMNEELGVLDTGLEPGFIGVYDHIYDDNVFGDPDYGTHYVVLAYQLKLERMPDGLPNKQHGDYRWWPVDELLASAEVHVYTKAYFR